MGWHDPLRDLIRFFDSPALPDIEVPAIPNDFAIHSLEQQQRVWWFDGVRWNTGRVNTPVDGSRSQYYIDFPNRVTEVRSGESLRVRWDRPISDVRGMVKSRAVETRFFHTARSQFLHNTTAQRAACQGLAGVLSAGIELHTHQLAAARRVLQDPVRRYLLADEVGLGKTVEAGMIARQLMIEEPGSVLVVTPSSLTSQWERELDRKFRFGALGGHVEVVSFAELSDVADITRRLVIIDEAHSLVSWSPNDVEAKKSYQRVRALSASADALLLLSATPVRSNEDVFLRLLHLLDPDSYPLEDIDGFRERVAMRDDLAALMSGLNPELPVAFLEADVHQALELVPDDPAIFEIVREFDAMADAGDEEAAQSSVRQLRSHLGETYRIHRRMIRTRRTKALSETFPVRGRRRANEWLIGDRDARRRQLPAFLDDVRLLLQPLDLALARRVLRSVIGRMNGPIEFLEELGQMLAGDDIRGLVIDDEEFLVDIVGTEVGRELGRLILDVAGLPTEVSRLDSVVEWARTHNGRTQVAVACSSTGIAERLAGLLSSELGQHRVAALTGRMSEADREASVRRFVEDGQRECTVLVIDRSAEEGLNLQTATKVLHVDLALSTNRLEQRLGRFDRWSGRVFDPIESVVFREDDEAQDAELGSWRRLIDEAFGIFEQSTATLQHVLPSFEERYIDIVLEDGPRAVAMTLPETCVELERQRRRIVQQDQLDVIEEAIEDVELIEAIAEIDSFPGEISASIKAYAVEALQLDIHEVGSPGSANGPRRRMPLVPISVAERLVQSDLGSGRGWTEYTSRRTEAVRNGTPLLRFGEPLVDRLLAFAERDDRGRTFIVEVPVRGLPATTISMFMFLQDLRIEVNPDSILELPKSERPGALSLAERFMPPRFERVLALDGVDEAPANQLETLLSRDSINLASRFERLEELLRGVNWEAMCDRRFMNALDVAHDRLSQRNDVGKALLRFDRFRTHERTIIDHRRRRGLDLAGYGDDVLRAVRVAIAEPRMILDSCGVLILTPEVQL